MNAQDMPGVKIDPENKLAVPRKCPACGARLTSQTVTCEYCGSSTLPVAFSLSQREEVRLLAEELNARLETNSALLKQLFKRKLWIGLVSYILLGIFLQFALRLTPQWVIAIPILCAAITFLILRKLYQAARASAFITIYFETLESQISKFIHLKSIPRWQFDNLADDVLDQSALLHLFLAGKSTTRKNP